MLQPIPLQPTLSWQEQLADLVTDPAELLDFLGLEAGVAGYSGAALADFPLRLTRSYLQKIRPGDPLDPLLRQVLPHQDETRIYPDYQDDPLDEGGALAIPGLLHKYASRVLLVTTSACAINCRYCFRRHFPYAENLRSREEMQEAFRYIADDPQINEVILSGGDPLVAPNRYLQWLLEAIFELPAVKRVRIHSRLPIVLPDRIDHGLLTLFGKYPGRIVMVLHANHARELDERLAIACRELQACRVLLLNQSVLLKGVNDDADTLCELSEGLFASGIQPYYLHVLDKVAGAAHFDMPETRAKALHQAMQARLPGYLVPKLVREAPGAQGKTPLL
jgi:EF-P beta-lysylation protein EpmB